jgi:hypothetical protein
MSKKAVDAFVRAKPKEISITETYRYKAEISDNDHLSFKEATGDIKVKFFYDGQDFPRKRLGFLRRWIFLHQQVRPEQTEEEKCFNIAALEDARKYANQCSMATVGHLILRGFQKPNFGERWPESKALPLKTPIDDLEQKFAQSQKYELCYTYSLQKPENPLLNFGRITLTDEASEDSQRSLRQSGSFRKLYSKVDEVLHLTLELIIEGGDPELDEDNQLPEDVVKHWWRESEKKKAEMSSEDKKKKKDKQQKEERKDSEDEQKDNQPVFEQFICFEGVCSENELREAIKYLVWRGGYLIIRLNKLDEIETLKKRLLNVAFKESIWLLPPYRHEKLSSKRRQWVIVPVPMQPESWEGYRRSHLSIESKPRSSLIEVSKILGSVDSSENLAKYLSAIANTADGKLVLPILSGNITNEKGNNLDQEVKDKLIEAGNCCRPRMSIHSLGFERLKDGVSVSIKRASSGLYSVKGEAVYIWEEGKPKELSVDETYQLIRGRFALPYPLITPLPIISYACIDWSCFDPREADGVRYDPQKKVIKWPDKVWFWQTPDHRFKLTLPLVINRPIELYRQGSIHGQLYFELGGYLKSGLEINYFDALGRQKSQAQDELLKVKKKSKLEVEFDITLDAIFRNRLFKTSRILEFEGIRPNVDRLEELKGIMGDLGLESIEIDYVDPWLSLLQISISDDAIEEGLARGGFVVTARRPPNLKITLQVTGDLKHIYRERKQGERADRMRVQTGNMEIIIVGEIKDEPSQMLSSLLNRLQQMITERFSHIGVQLV